MVETTHFSDNDSPYEPVNLDDVFTPPSREEWLTTALKGLPNHDSIESLARHTLDNIAIQSLYDSTPDSASTEAIGSQRVPGSWDNRLFVAPTVSEADANRTILDGLQGGISSLEISTSKNTQLHKILDGVNLELSAVSFRTDGSLDNCADKVLGFAKDNSVDLDGLHCDFNNDPVGLWLAGLTDRAPELSVLNQLPTFAKSLSSTLPLARTVVVDIAIHHNAGASVTQELTAAIATASAYLEALMQGGLNLEQASRQIVFQMACDADVLMGVVKLRSLDVLWQHVLREFSAYSGHPLSDQNAVDLASTQINVETSARFLSRQDHWNNHLRNIASCTAAAVGNASTIIVKPHDRLSEQQSESDNAIGERVARNLPIILDRECGLTQVSDPMAGSFAIETLTSELVGQTWNVLSELNISEKWFDKLISGAWQNELTATHEKRLSRLHSDERILVGVNRYQPSSTEEGSDSSDVSLIPHTSLTHSSTPRLEAVRDAEPFEQTSRMSDDAKRGGQS